MIKPPETAAEKRDRRKRERVRLTLARVDCIQQTLPAHPKNHVNGRKLPYRSERFRQVEEMIGICRKLSDEIFRE